MIKMEVNLGTKGRLFNGHDENNLTAVTLSIMSVLAQRLCFTICQHSFPGFYHHLYRF